MALQQPSWSKIAQISCKAIQPGEKGQKTAKCRGQMLAVLGSYGWILPHDTICHPDSEKHAGRIWVHRNDFRKGSKPRESDEVEFFLYADENGLGAEDCRVRVAGPRSKGRNGSSRKCNTSEQASVFLMSPHAHEFTPGQMNAHAVDFVPQHHFEQMWPCATQSVMFNGDAFEDDDDKSSDQEDHSTSAGESADSEGETSTGTGHFTGLQSIDPPPGLEFNWCSVQPPPGLA